MGQDDVSDTGKKKTLSLGGGEPLRLKKPGEGAAAPSRGGMGGGRKTEFLRAYGADIFFDDQAEHCQLASHVVVSGHVPHGIKNPRLFPNKNHD